MSVNCCSDFRVTGVVREHGVHPAHKEILDSKIERIFPRHVKEILEGGQTGVRKVERNRGKAEEQTLSFSASQGR